MLLHRWGTFLQLMSITELQNPLKRAPGDQVKQFTVDDAVKFTKEAQKQRYTNPENHGKRIYASTMFIFTFK